MQKAMGVNSTVQKSVNRGLVFQHLVTGRARSRAELAKTCGLTRMTVTNIIAEFVEKGYVAEEENRTGKAARNNPIQLTVSPQGPKVIGILIQRNFISVAYCDCTLQTLDSKLVWIKDYTARSLLDAVFSVMDQFVQKENIIGIGIGALGPVDIRRGVILNPPNFNEVHDLSIRNALLERYALPVVLDHNYNCAALAEKYFGNCRNDHNFMYLGLTDGIGLGLVSNDRLYSDFTGSASEIGHVSINFNGPPCSCGNNGCLETYASAKAIEKAVFEATGEAMDFKTICAVSDRPAIDHILMDMIYYLQIGLTGCVNLLNPQAIVIGDDGAYLPDRYLGYLEQVLNSHILSKNYRHIKIKKPMLQDQYSAAPCAMGILMRLFDGELLF